VRHAGKHSTRLIIETSVPILRGADILAPNQVKTPCGRLYMAVQLLYVDPAKNDEYMALYLSLTKDLLAAAPSMAQHLVKTSLHVASGEYYQALQAAKQLLKYERILLGTEAEGPELVSQSADKTKT
jgi:flagellar biosynthesis repressor protein FlbT